MDKTHGLNVQRISQQVEAFFKNKKSFRIFHGATNSTRVLTFKKDEIIDISGLNHVLSIDSKKHTAVVEPNVSMDTLVKATLRHNLIPPVVMEFPGITVGGAVQGNGGESSSFKWGTFNQTLNWYEIITADGEIRTASDKENSDLFYATPGSAGTLGILTAAEITLIPAKKYVELKYIPVHSFEDAKNIIESIHKNESDFVDGIMFSKSSGVIIVGQLTDKATAKIRRFSRAHDQWYYLHVENTYQANPQGWTETVPLTDYLFRYDRGAFWVGRFAFEMFNIPYTRFMRWVLNPILHTRKLYQALQESGASQEHVVQDLVLSSESFVQFAQFIDTEFNTYPLWLCPMLPDTKALFQLNNLKTESIINVGVWGSRIPVYDDFIKANKVIEKKVLAIGGKKWSYAHSYFSEKEFWSMYDKKLYDKLRIKYHAESLATIYDKITVTKRHPIQKRKAVLKTLFGIAKLKIEK
ncbi:MAG: binding domain protein [Candidatus Saccharibacteria bacterium]|nr:binding domain protein [Candidatus Saccharibacteria bacterium]